VTRIALALVVRDGRVLITRRRAGTHLAGMWEFPGGKIRPGEEAAGAALRELQEETGLVAERAEPVLSVPYSYPDRRVLLEVFQVIGVAGQARALDCEEIAWRRPAEIRDESMPPANAPILAFLRTCCES
jgi:8-oxo-dGTP diphosphatase